MNESGNASFLIVGLGNPGREYRATRHNIGFVAVDELCQAFSIRLARLQSKALVGTGTWNGKKIILAKPQAFMNLSGQPVSSLLRFYKIPLEQLMVIHDDLDLPVGTLRMRPGGGSAGQKGLGSIIAQLGTESFPRLRIGVGRPPGQMDAADYVLEGFSAAEKELLPQVLSRAVEATQDFIEFGLEHAMNAFNGTLQKE
jgi:PTH1 family peptidyl-tRNA hydrolase